MKIFMTAGLAALGLLATTSLSHASTMVLGNSAAATCYKLAKAKDASSSALATCDSAFEDVLSSHDRAATYVNRGVLRFHAGNIDGAINDYKAAAALEPQLAEIYVNWGVATLHQEHGAEAVELISKGLDLSPSEPALAYYSRAVAYELSGQVTAAYKDYKKAAELAPRWDAPADQLSRFTVKTVSTSQS